MTLTPGDYIALASLIVLTVGPIFGLLHKMRRNDLYHLDEKIDRHHAAVMNTLTRYEEKLDTHLRDHATGVFTHTP
jgi:hypothetical protein